MAKLIKTQTTKTSSFTLGDKVQFQIITRYDNYSPEYGWVYGFVSKVNKRTLNVICVNAELYKVDISELQKYVDPFEGIRGWS